MRQITIDCCEFTSRADVHRAFAEALSFPACYGYNLDALHDCLTDICEETGIQMLHWDAAEAQVGDFCRILRTVLNVSCEDNPQLHIEYC